MEVSETVFVFVIVPAAIVLFVGGLAYAAGGGRRGRRYRPGRPFDVAPVWFLSASAAGPQSTATEHGGSTPALPARRPVAPLGATGGASDQW